MPNSLCSTHVPSACRKLPSQCVSHARSLHSIPKGSIPRAHGSFLVAVGSGKGLTDTEWVPCPFLLFLTEKWKTLVLSCEEVLVCCAGAFLLLTSLALLCMMVLVAQNGLITLHFWISRPFSCSCCSGFVCRFVPMRYIHFWKVVLMYPQLTSFGSLGHDTCGWRREMRDAMAHTLCFRSESTASMSNVHAY
ncbi:hypothetical protein BCR44DRAFT_241699 [Catenaria anguillulae PL171]|uniref:Uncharacterized protein n=1 Tax=Catenaria anguillulae PL171 TaxID=765915 RepID=A0A1Y2H8U6_9FUNG|nr:hypothetical protein BCR44DRAFT_241699 [Catenaria anguillulae PL171]